MTGTPAPRPRLLHVCGRFLPLSETFTYDLVRGLDGFEHHVVANTREHADVFPWPSVEVHAVDAEAGAWPRIAGLGIDAVLCHFGPQCTRGLPLAAMLDVPVATIFHGYDISRLLRDRAWVERYRACHAAGMHALCISDAGRRRLLGIGWPDAQIAVVHLGVDPQRFRFTMPSARRPAGRPLRLLTVARLVPKKGIDIALAAAATLSRAGVAYEWRIVGDGPECDALQAQARRLALADVHWDGAVPRDQVVRALEWADVYVQPSVTAASGDEEGIPVSLMEAMAAGRPVVSTRHSGIPELVEDDRTGLLTDEGDADALADAISRLESDGTLADRLADAARVWIDAEFNQRRQLQRTDAWVRKTLIGADCRRPSYRSQPRRGRGLIVQTIDAGLLARKCTLLAERHPDLRFDVLARDADAAGLASLPYIASVRAADADAEATDCRGYDLAIIPAGDDTGTCEPRAVALAVGAGAARVVCLTLRDREIALAEVPS